MGARNSCNMRFSKVKLIRSGQALLIGFALTSASLAQEPGDERFEEERPTPPAVSPLERELSAPRPNGNGRASPNGTATTAPPNGGPQNRTPNGATAPAAPTPPPTANGGNGTPPVLKRGEVMFNFQDADVQAVVKTVSQMTGRNFLIDPRVKGKITIISAKPVSSSAAYQIFLSALKAQGFTAVPGPGGITKILPEGEGKQSAVVSRKIPTGGDQLTTQVVVVQHGSATQMVPLLRPLMAPSGLLSVYAPANTLVITDYAANIRRLMQIIDRLDQQGSAEVTIIPLEYASALDMAQLLSKLADNVTVQVGGAPQQQQQQQVGGADANRLSIVPDLRTNSLLVRTDNQGRLDQMRSLIAKLDVPAKVGGNTRVVYLRNAEAAKLAEILRGLMAGEARAQPAAQQAPGQPAQAAGAKVEASTIQADEASNALIISAPDAVYNNLRGVIEKLDVRRAQVYVEALIAEVRTDKASQFGFQWAGAASANGGAVGGVANFPLTGSSIVETAVGAATGVPPIGAGLSIAYIGETITLADGREIRGLGALVRALDEDNGANILSTPNILTLDNEEAKIIIGQDVPVLTGSYAQTGATAVSNAAGVNPFQTIQRKDIGVQLKIKPQISEGNGIKLQIIQEVSSIARAATGAQDLVFNKRALETTVIVDDGHTVALGGLLDDQAQDNSQGVPFLSRIPLLGELFKYRERRKEKTNLMIFLRPIIVRGAREAQGFTADRYEYIRGQQRASKMKQELFVREFDVPVLPELQQPVVKEVVPAPTDGAVPSAQSPQSKTNPAPPAGGEPALLGPPGAAHF